MMVPIFPDRWCFQAGIVTKKIVFIAYGSGKKPFDVRRRVGCRNVGGRNLPVNGPTIRHIVDGAYVPIEKTNP